MRYKLFFLSVSMFVVSAESRSQSVESDCVRYPYNTQVGINLNVNMLSKMRIQQNYYVKSSPSEYFRSYPSFGADLGVYLYQRVYKWFGIQIGAEYSATTICYKFDYKDYNSTYMDYNSYGAFTFPILFNASYYFNEKHGIDISLGGAPLVLFAGDNGQGFGIGTINEYNSNRCHFRLDNDTRFNFSLYGKIGYNFLLKNKNTLGVAIIGSYAAEPYMQGRYEIFIDKIEVERGYTSIRNTFIGLQFSYGFTMKKLLCVPANKEN